NFAFLRLTVSKDHVVVGEKFSCFVRFYYTDEVTNLVPIHPQQIPGFSILDQIKTNRGTQNINGKDYNYIEMSWDMMATQPGKHVIPAHYADYVVQSNQHDFMGHLSLFLNHLGEQKRIYSNAVTVGVDP